MSTFCFPIRFGLIFCYWLDLSFAAKLRKILEIKNIFAKNFGSSGKSSTFAGDLKEITCDDGLHLGKK